MTRTVTVAALVCLALACTKKKSDDSSRGARESTASAGPESGPPEPSPAVPSISPADLDEVFGEPSTLLQDSLLKEVHDDAAWVVLVANPASLRTRLGFDTWPDSTQRTLREWVRERAALDLFDSEAIATANIDLTQPVVVAISQQGQCYIGAHRKDGSVWGKRRYQPGPGKTWLPAGPVHDTSSSVHRKVLVPRLVEAKSKELSTLTFGADVAVISQEVYGQLRWVAGVTLSDGEVLVEAHIVAKKEPSASWTWWLERALAAEPAGGTPLQPTPVNKALAGWKEAVGPHLTTNHTALGITERRAKWRKRHVEGLWKRAMEPHEALIEGWNPAQLTAYKEEAKRTLGALEASVDKLDRAESESSKVVRDKLLSLVAAASEGPLGLRARASLAHAPDAASALIPWFVQLDESPEYKSYEEAEEVHDGVYGKHAGDDSVSEADALEAMEDLVPVLTAPTEARPSSAREPSGLRDVISN